ncbi:DUF4845 domain-containing protein [Montanilutibacter psychrotolerans]|uniref:DUF4845 domain-containing protein n=1 Tax=Montanilutibacter psychrotolerans TaxID=1327343 RepID=A0A3M8T2I6_9GAMM|nr:DUF4845 domain-containing protein [Lysobacter psychrotolerans]RNF84972.1 DUF4845 domain-containing protein [Lysobacter psychrotolerans]
MKHNQRGITLIGFIMVLAVVGVFAYMGMKLVPMYSEYYSVKRSLSALASEPGAATMDAFRLRESLSRRFDTSYIESVKPEDVKIVRKDSNAFLLAEYEVRKPLIANIDVVGRFKVEQPLRPDGTE